VSAGEGRELNEYKLKPEIAGASRSNSRYHKGPGRREGGRDMVCKPGKCSAGRSLRPERDVVTEAKKRKVVGRKFTVSRGKEFLKTLVDHQERKVVWALAAAWREKMGDMTAESNSNAVIEDHEEGCPISRKEKKGKKKLGDDCRKYDATLWRNPRKKRKKRGKHLRHATLRAQTSALMDEAEKTCTHCGKLVNQSNLAGKREKSGKGNEGEIKESRVAAAMRLKKRIEKIKGRLTYLVKEGSALGRGEENRC